MNLETKPFRAKRSDLTCVSTSSETLVTPTISSPSVSKEEVSQLPEDISTDPSETVTEVVQQKVDFQLEIAQQECTSKLESVQPEVNPESILVEIEVTSQPEVVEELLSGTVVHLHEHLDFECEQLEVVALPKDDQWVTPLLFIFMNI